VPNSDSTVAPSYIPATPGFAPFARVSPRIVLDPDLRPRQRLVYMILALHSNAQGYGARLAQASIAELCGFFLKSRTTGEYSPDYRLVSRLISDEKWATRTPCLGPGLVQLGYVQKLGQSGHNHTISYKLVFPPFENNVITRPDGSTATSRS
jgi:hypothetical protein